MNDYELIDTTDNDCHDTGTRQEMQQFAQDRNRDDERYNADQPDPAQRVKPNRWKAKPAGYSSDHFKG